MDEANDRTYVVMAERVLTDGELYSIIRLEILRRGRLAKGERLVISVSKCGKAAGVKAVSDQAAQALPA